MLMNQVLRSLVLVTFSLAAQEALATNISAGTSEFVSIRNCTVAGVSGCDSISSILFQQYGGLPGDSASSANVDEVGYGSSSGNVALSGVIGAPVLKGSSVSELGKRISSNSIALQRYVYTGDTPTTRSFGGTITYSEFSTGSYPSGPGGGINANIDIFTLPTSTIAIAPTAAANFNMLFSGLSSLSGYTSLGSANYNDQTSALNASGNLSVAVTLNPGDSIWVWVILQTPATNGGWVDASHTFITAWSETSSLVPAVVAVPEFGAFGLWLAGGLSVAWVARQRRGGVQRL
jgi:hypothetical protein